MRIGSFRRYKQWNLVYITRGADGLFLNRASF